MLKKALPIASLIVLAILTAGCATPARVGDMVDQTGKRPTLNSVNLKTNIFVDSVVGGEETNPLWTSEIGSKEFQTALEQSLAKAGLLDIVRNDSAYLLTVNMLEVDQPWGGLDMTVIATVRYVLIDKLSGEEIYNRIIAIPYTAEFSEAFLAMERLRKANEGAARVNIKEFVDDLYNLRIER